MYGYIYKTTNLVNGKIYIGQKKSNVFLGDKYLGSGKILKMAIEKYGKENFKREILRLCFTINQLNGYETYYIIKLKAMESSVGYNMVLGGVGFRSGVNDPCYNNPTANPFYGKKHTQETKNIISKKNKGRIPPNKGKKLSEETRKKMSESAKRRMSIPENNPMYGKMRITNGVENKIIDSNSPIPDGWRRGMKRYDKRQTEYHKKVMKERMSGSNNPMYGKVSPNKGKKMSDEQKKKLRISALKRYGKL